jgi:26S proteasome regulatory subunit N11
MLLNLHKKNWTEGLKLQDWETMKSSNEESIKVSRPSRRARSALR